MSKAPEDDGDFGVEINRKGQEECIKILGRRGLLKDPPPADVLGGLLELKRATDRYLAAFRSKGVPVSEQEGVEATCMAYFHLWLEAQLDSPQTFGSGKEVIQ